MKPMVASKLYVLSCEEYIAVQGGMLLLQSLQTRPHGKGKRGFEGVRNYRLKMRYVDYKSGLNDNPTSCVH